MTASYCLSAIHSLLDIILFTTNCHHDTRDTTMRLKIATCLLALLAVTAFAPLTARASITINSTEIKAVARAVGSLDIRPFLGTDIPTPPQVLNAGASAGGLFWATRAYSQNTIEFSENNGQTTLLITIDRHESGDSVAGNTYAGTFAGIGSDNLNEQGTALSFTVSTSMSYELSGIYGLTGDQSIRQVAKLVDVGTSEVLFNNDQKSSNTSNETFTLGESGGDQSNVLSGSLIGQLLAGHTYEWSFGARLDYLNYTTMTSAEGYFKLVLSEATDPGVVPEAASLLTWCGLALTAYWGKTARRRRD
jgi:hypothetical protein